jgi:hypothetical protein
MLDSRGYCRYRRLAHRSIGVCFYESSFHTELGTRPLGPAAFLYPYSPDCVEVAFSEVHEAK